MQDVASGNVGIPETRAALRGRKNFFAKNRFALEAASLLIVGLLVAYSLWLVFMVVPNERVMGPVQRIFYFHVGSAIACYCSVAVVLLSSLAYLATRNRLFDAFSEAGASVGFAFASIVMVSGMIWARPIWNTWFHWEPRLVSFLLLWLIFVALMLLRRFGDPERTPAHCAVLGVLGAITVPIVVFSIQLLPQIAQLHPQVVANRGLRTPEFRHAWAVTTIAMICFQFFLVYVRARAALLQHRVSEID
jgi:heme exporter protein C